MTNVKSFWHLLAGAVIIALAGWWLRQQTSESSQGSDYPSRPIHVVVPYAAGGGSDTFVRIIQQGIAAEGLLGQPLVIVNQAGGIGTIGSREVKNAAPDGYKILCHHNAIITAKLAGTVTFGPEAFEPIAMTGEMSMVILVRADAPFANLLDLLRKAAESPNTVRFGANKGAPAYFTALQLEKSYPGAELSIVSSGGGADRYSKIIGGHLEAGIFSLSEYLDFRAVEGTPTHQDVRAIAVLSQLRHESIPDIPTAMELGLPVVLSNANYWWAPKGTPSDRLEKLASVLEAAMENASVQSELRRLRMDATFARGTSLRQQLQQTTESFESVAAEKPASLPPFPIYVGAIVVLLLVWVVIEGLRGADKRAKSMANHPRENFQKRPGVALTCFLVLCAYVLVLGLGAIPFAVATTIMVMIVGGLMMRHAPGRWWVLLELSLLTGLGTQFVFTEILVTLLP